MAAIRTIMSKEINDSFFISLPSFKVVGIKPDSAKRLSYLV